MVKDGYAKRCSCPRAGWPSGWARGARRRRGRRKPRPLRRGAHRGRGQAPLAGTTSRTRSSATSSRRPRSSGSRRARDRQRHDRRPLRRPGTTGSPPTRTGISRSTGTRDVRHPRRRPPEVDRRGARADAPRRPPRGAPAYTASERDEAIRAYRTRCSSGLGTPTGGRSSTSARRPSSAGELIAPPGYEQEGAQRAGHIPTAQSIPWASAVARRRHVQVGRGTARVYGGKGVTLTRR